MFAFSLLVGVAFGCMVPQGPSSSTQSAHCFAAGIQEAMGISARNDSGDFLTSLENVIGAFDPEQRISEQDLPQVPAVLRLVDALNAGAAPGAYSDTMLDLVTLEDGSHLLLKTGWKYGNQSHVSALASKLFERAKTLASFDRQNGARFGRAAVLLAAHTNFSLAQSDVARFMREDGFQDLLDLNDDEYGSLVAFVEARAAEEEQFFSALSDLYDARKEILELPIGRPVDAAISDRVIDALKGAWDYRYSNPYSTHRFCLLARGTVRAIKRVGDHQLAARVSEQLAGWHEAEPDGPTKRWLHEVLVDAKSGKR